MVPTCFKYLSFALLLLVNLTFANDDCIITDNLELPPSKQNKINCLKSARFVTEPPAIHDIQEIKKGPQLKEISFNFNDTVYCRYFYRYQNGASNKFRCYRTNENNQLYNNKGELILNAVGVKINSDQDEYLVDEHGQYILDIKNKPMKADILKVRFQDGTNRHRENYASTLATRIAWIMGIPSEHYYAVKKVTCFGCQKNPWNEGINPQKDYFQGIQNDFLYAAIERKNEAKRVIKAFVPQNKKFEIVPWKWTDFSQNKDKINEEQKEQFEVLTLFANFLQIMEHRGSQHVLLCQDEFYDKSKKVCHQTLAAIHDMGASFGNRMILDTVSKNRPRADYRAYQKAQLFKLNTCQLAYEKAGIHTFTQKSLDNFNQRLALLTPEVLRALLEVSYFYHADAGLKKELQKKYSAQGVVMSEADLNQKIIDAWVNLILEKIAQHKNLACPN